LHKKQDIEKLNQKLKHIYTHIQSLGQAWLNVFFQKKVTLFL
jgi:hypothetical protein